MGELEELKKKLYGREEAEEEKWGERQAIRGYGRRGREETKTFWGGDGLEVMKKRPTRKRSRWLVNLFIFSFVVLIGVALYVSYEIFFVREEINVTIVGPEGVELGERSDFAIFIRNIGRVGIETLELNITYPENSVPLELTGEPKEATREKVIFEKISPGEEVKHDIAVRFLGKTGDEVPISVLAVYRPENIQSRLTKKASFVPKITRTPFIISFGTPDRKSVV